MASEQTILTVDGPNGPRDMRISSPSRVLWPELGLTKLDLARYIVDVGEAFIAANGDRPVSLQRFSDNVDGEQFFSKNPPKGTPDFVRSVKVTYPSARSHPQLVLDEPAGRGVGRADEHRRVPPVAFARRELRQPGPAAHRP